MPKCSSPDSSAITAAVTPSNGGVIAPTVIVPTGPPTWPQRADSDRHGSGRPPGIPAPGFRVIPGFWRYRAGKYAGQGRVAWSHDRKFIETRLLASKPLGADSRCSVQSDVVDVDPEDQERRRPVPAAGAQRVGRRRSPCGLETRPAARHAVIPARQTSNRCSRRGELRGTQAAGSALPGRSASSTARALSMIGSSARSASAATRAAIVASSAKCGSWKSFNVPTRSHTRRTAGSCADSGSVYASTPKGSPVNSTRSPSNSSHAVLAASTGRTS